MRANELERGRQSYEQRAWMDAYTLLSRADEATPLEAEDLEPLATSSSMVGRMRPGRRVHREAHRGAQTQIRSDDACGGRSDALSHANNRRLRWAGFTRRSA